MYQGRMFETCRVFAGCLALGPGCCCDGACTAPCRSGEAPVLPSADDLGRGDETPTAGGPKCSKEKNRQVGC
jgi:hypothetical protein